MKKLCFFLFIMPFFTFSQSESRINLAFDANENSTFNQIIESGNLYYSNKDINKKGSGYKQFKRWQSIAKNYVKSNGYLMNNDEINTLRLNVKSSIQSQSQNRSAISNWESIGPFNYEDSQNRMSGQGRVNSITVSPHNPNEYWVGTPGGGAWQSLDAGLTWAPKTDNMPNLGVSAVAIDPVNPLVIYVGTGDDEGSTFSGRDGLYKSIDGGSVWTKINIGNDVFCDIYINPLNNNEIYAAGNGGFIKSIDGGQTWATTFSGSSQNIKVKPGDWSTVYYSTRDKFYVSIDSGNTWTETTTGLPTSFIQRIMIDVSPNTPNNVYAVIAAAGSQFHGIYVSTDSGNSFSKVDNGNNNLMESSQAFYDLDIAVDPTNSSNIYTGCLNVWNSIDGGVDFSRINEWDKDYQPTYTHADIHQIRFFNGSVFVASDGGIYRSDDNGVSFTDLTKGIANAEIYEINASPIDTDHIVAGLQDNGGYAYNGRVWRNWHWSDGTSNAIDPNNPNLMHSLFQTGAGYFMTEDSGQTTRDLLGNGSGSWETPMAVNSLGEVFVANVFLGKRVNDAWVNLYQFPSSVYAMEIAPSDDSIIYANTGVELFRSSDGGITFSSVNTSISTSFVEGIAIHPTNPDIVYIVTSNISSGGVYKSTDGGQNFTNINSNLTMSLPLRCLEIQPFHSDNPIYLGTDFGVYRMDDVSGIWEPFQASMPNALVRDLSIDARGEELIAGTYGRGAWKTKLPQKQETIDASLNEIVATLNEVEILPYNPVVNIKNTGLNSISNPVINYTINSVPGTENNTALLVADQSENINLPVINTRGFYKINAEVVVSGDVKPINNTKEKLFILNDFGLVGQVNSFENPSDALINFNSDEINSMWEMGIPTGTLLNSASNGSQVYGTNLTGVHSGYKRAYLYTQYYDLTSITNPILSFDMATDIPNGNALYVQYSLDNGNSWSLLGTASDTNWYNSSNAQWQGLGTAWQGGQWSGVSNYTMQNYTYNLTPWNSESAFLMRFVFEAKFNASPILAEGVILDNLVVTGTTLSNPEIDSNNFNIAVFPNPTKSIVNFKHNKSNNIEASVYDILGKKIIDFTIDKKEYTLDMNYYPSGFYLIKFNLEGIIITKKIVLQ